MDSPMADGGENPTVLDLTSYQLRDLDSVDLPPSLTELDLTANRLSKLDPRIAQLSNLKKLSLRQNLFDDSGVEPLATSHLIADLEVLFVFITLINLAELLIFFLWIKWMVGLN